jgi:hypothetical protein
VRASWILAIGVAGLALAACSTTRTASPATVVESSTTTSTTHVQQSVLPVNPCSVSYGAPVPGRVWQPTQLTAEISPSLKGKIAFYSTGTETILAPVGWVCTALVAADGGSSVAVAPLGQRSTESGSANTDSYSVTALFDYTGHGPGMDLVCPYFPPPDAAKDPGCETTKPAGEVPAPITNDILSITDPAGVRGHTHASVGVLIYPKVHAYASASVNIAEETCSLSTMVLCPAILSDFQIREFPVPVPSQSG